MIVFLSYKDMVKLTEEQQGKTISSMVTMNDTTPMDIKTRIIGTDVVLVCCSSYNYRWYYEIAYDNAVDNVDLAFSALSEKKRGAIRDFMKANPGIKLELFAPFFREPVLSLKRRVREDVIVDEEHSERNRCRIKNNKITKRKQSKKLPFWQRRK